MRFMNAEASKAPMRLSRVKRLPRTRCISQPTNERRSSRFSVRFRAALSVQRNVAISAEPSYVVVTSDETRGVLSTASRGAPATIAYPLRTARHSSTRALRLSRIAGSSNSNPEATSLSTRMAFGSPVHIARTSSTSAEPRLPRRCTVAKFVWTSSVDLRISPDAGDGGYRCASRAR